MDFKLTPENISNYIGNIFRITYKCNLNKDCVCIQDMQLVQYGVKRYVFVTVSGNRFNDEHPLMFWEYRVIEGEILCNNWCEYFILLTEPFYIEREIKNV